MSAPAWFESAIATPCLDGSVMVDGANITYQHWQQPGKPGLLLVHGHAAHAHWWDFIAPAFLPDHDVIAINLSGAGDSDHREQYSASQFAREIQQVAEAAGIAPCVLVGHSFGGSMARIAAHLHPASFSALVIVDSFIARTRANRPTPPAAAGRVRTYKGLAEGKRRFRLRPPQPYTHDYIIDHIAGHSLRETPDGWMFKLDQGVFSKMTVVEEFPDAYSMVQSLPMPVGLIYGRESRFFPQAGVEDLVELFPGERMAGIDGAHHHVFLDQPLAFVQALDSMLTVLEAD